MGELKTAQQRGVDEPARVAKISPTTLYRWMKDLEFDRAYRAARRATFSQSVARLQQAARPAAAVPRGQPTLPAERKGPTLSPAAAASLTGTARPT
jgi:hypothetical protein